MIEKSVPRITDLHHEACQVMTNSDDEGWIFLSHHHTNYGFLLLLTTKYQILYWEKHDKRLPEMLKMLRCDMVTSFYHCNDVAASCAANVLLFVFYLSLGLAWVCEIELSHLGKTTEIPIWYARKEFQYQAEISDIHICCGIIFNLHKIV